MKRHAPRAVVLVRGRHGQDLELSRTEASISVNFTNGKKALQERGRLRHRRGQIRDHPDVGFELLVQGLRRLWSAFERVGWIRCRNHFLTSLSLGTHVCRRSKVTSMREVSQFPRR